ncbi:PEPxxWA-CTERM sorting domain-containing protein [Sphingomonas sp. MAH-20]|uniref:PEPxxWA-CTERM sorting domain-containing protein n=1 Tax=Sphingomonas horti TaxID=2682842 RepID=A0A6I4IYY4_9SPHN|nr:MULTISPECIES: PEPxxWA-CTERM sorting domain-containing protein [Sphingomonas]MBA2918398.1 PEP-CTERM sorting domain-containing protein [Sphingomonas sp. CGMCC 1.13658]MVO77365.1 PEPxxWA-CTERM sorting domain-containing protein [Sphingomonas horti]
MLRSIMAAALGAAIASSTALAAEVVAPNAYATTDAPTLTVAIINNGAATTFQFAYAASQFAGVAAGSKITSIGFRAEPGFAAAQDFEFSRFDVQLATLATPLNAMSGVFADNVGADAVQVRSGALSIPAASITASGPTPYPFFTIGFSQAFTYHGGDLVVTLRRSAPDTLNFFGVDAVAVGNGITGSVGGGSGPDATQGEAGFYNVPVVQFGIAAAAVPEPGTWALMIIGFGSAGLAARRKGVAVAARA